MHGPECVSMFAWRRRRRRFANRRNDGGSTSVLPTLHQAVMDPSCARARAKTDFHPPIRQARAVVAGDRHIPRQLNKLDILARAASHFERRGNVADRSGTTKRMRPGCHDNFSVRDAKLFFPRLFRSESKGLMVRVSVQVRVRNILDRNKHG